MSQSQTQTQRPKEAGISSVGNGWPAMPEEAKTIDAYLIATSTRAHDKDVDDIALSMMGHAIPCDVFFNTRTKERVRFVTMRDKETAHVWRGVGKHAEAQTIEDGDEWLLLDSTRKQERIPHA